jgi:2-iminobutanoate/2-iminopropanoate deaminase
VTTPIGPYSAIVRAGDWLICSGQLGLADGRLVDGVSAQTTQAIQNAEALLAGHGASLTDVVKTLVFLTDMADYDAMNDAYVAAFGDHRPARSAVGVAALPRGGRVEVEVWAMRAGG